MNEQNIFQIKDCALIALATGERAQNLRELEDRLRNTDVACVYYHVWGSMLRPRFDDPEYQNDFAAWAHRDLHDQALAEKLTSVDPSRFADLEDLRQEFIDIIEERLDELEYIPWTKGSRQFFFVRSQVVVFDTDMRVDTPMSLLEHIRNMSFGSIFYHFVEARRRNANRADDFSEWLMGFGERYAGITKALKAIDPYFNSLKELRNELIATFENALMESRGTDGEPI